MNKTISSDATFVYKFIFPVVWIGGFGFHTIDMLISRDPHRWMLLVMWVVASLYLAWLNLPLKRVRIERTDLVISNFVKSVSVPTAHIQAVTQYMIVRYVCIHFRKPTPFGKKIMFMPKADFKIFSSHSIVAELMELSKQENSQQPTARSRGGRSSVRARHWE